MKFAWNTKRHYNNPHNSLFWDMSSVFEYTYLHICDFQFSQTLSSRIWAQKCNWILLRSDNATCHLLAHRNGTHKVDRHHGFCFLGAQTSQNFNCGKFLTIYRPDFRRSNLSYLLFITNGSCRMIGMHRSAPWSNLLAKPNRVNIIIYCISLALATNLDKK